VARFCVALTGGVASGKTAATRAFESLGVTVADADLAAREAVAPGSPGLAAIRDLFGDDILAADGSLDRRRMRERVFEDAPARRQLEAIVHPHVRLRLREQCLQAAGAYAIAAIPLLVEGGGRAAYPWLRRVAVVDTPAAIQLERLIRRDGIDEALARRMIAVQATREARLAAADDVLVNDRGPADLERHVAALDRRYRMLAALPA
jgi:dephospho-CoA kinase